MNYLFSYTCDDEEPAPPALDLGFLSWRLPAEETHSDWTIEIVERESNKSRIYHVHKCCISVGPKKSDYFMRLFLNTNFAEAETKTSKIELEPAAATAFPCMLDYLYSREHKLEITSENATPLYFLGQYFEIHRLRWEVMQFCETDLSIDNCGTYYEHAKIFRDEKIAMLVAKKCCNELSQIGFDSHLMEVSDVALWSSVIKLTLDGRHGQVVGSKYLSQLIAKFCISHKELVDAETFTYLTDATHMPVIDKAAAIPLLQLEGLLVPESKTGEALTSLQSRCIEPIGSSWDSIDARSLMHDLADLNPMLLACTLKMAFGNAKSDKKKAEQLVVKKVRVEGAGIDEVNGTYIRTEKTLSGAPTFAMEGMFQGSSVVFEIFLSTCENDATGPKYWYIASKLNTDVYTGFYPYNAACVEGNLFTPALTGWRTTTSDASNGRSPAPTLKLLPNDESSS